jgi:hypothetical protein
MNRRRRSGMMMMRMIPNIQRGFSSNKIICIYNNTLESIIERNEKLQIHSILSVQSCILNTLLEWIEFMENMKKGFYFTTT